MPDIDLPAPGEDPNWAPKLNTAVSTLNTALDDLKPGQRGGASLLDPVTGAVTNADGDPVFSVQESLRTFNEVIRPISGESYSACASRIQTYLNNYDQVTLSGYFQYSTALLVKSSKTIILQDAILERMPDGYGNQDNLKTGHIITNRRPDDQGDYVDTNINVVGIGRAILRVHPSVIQERRDNKFATAWHSIGVPWLLAEGVKTSNVTIGPTAGFAANTQLVSSYEWNDIVLAQDGVINNQDGIDHGPGSKKGKISGIRGTAGDDLFSLYAQRTSFSILPWVKTLVQTTPERGNIEDITFSNISADWGLTSGNGMRFQAGDGCKLQRISIDGFVHDGIHGHAIMQFGHTGYVGTPPAKEDMNNISMRGFRGGFETLIGADSNFTDVSIEGEIDGSWEELIGNPSVIDNFMPDIGTISLQLRSSVNARPLPGVISRLKQGVIDRLNLDINIAEAAMVFANVGRVRRVFGRVNVEQLNGPIYYSRIAEQGELDVSRNRLASYLTPTSRDSAPAIRIGRRHPMFKSIDRAPAAIPGSLARYDNSATPTGAAATEGAEWTASGISWVKSFTGTNTAPVAINNFAFTPISDTSVRLSWDGRAGSDEYRVQGKRFQPNTYEYREFGTTRDTYMIIKGLRPGTNYVFNVRGLGEGGSGTPSTNLIFDTTGVAPSDFVLDQVSSPAWRAYSLRRVRGQYSGPLIRAIRTDGQTMNVPYSGDGLDTAALMSWVGSQSAWIDMWYDQSGNDLHMTCDLAFSTATPRRAMIVNAGVLVTRNSRAAALYNTARYVDRFPGLYDAGSATMMMVAAKDHTVNPTSQSWIAEAGPANGGGGGYYPLRTASTGGASAVNMQRVIQDYDPAFNPVLAPLSGTTAETPAAYDGTLRSIIAVDTGSSFQRKVDGTLVGTTGYSRTGKRVSPDYFTMGAIYRDSAGFWVGYIENGYQAEILMFKGAISDAEQATIRTNEKTYWGLA